MAPLVSPDTWPVTVAGRPPRRMSIPVVCWPLARVTGVALSTVRLCGYHSSVNPAPRKRTLYDPATRSANV